MDTVVSLLDIAPVQVDEPMGTALGHCVEVAQTAERAGYRRVWYAEHHNMPTIASSATSVLIAHVAANTQTIGLGAGGVMLPNHSPLVIAEQFGMLAELHPGRIDLGLGRAPGTDGETFRALRRPMNASDNFPHDVLELARYLSNDLPRSAVNAYPGRGTEVPLTILGSSLFGANLAAQLGMPYSFASHFAPDALRSAVRHYRDNYVPSEAHPESYVSIGMNVVAAETNGAAAELYERVKVSRVRQFLSRGRDTMLTTEEAEMLMNTPAGMQILGMLKHTAVGDASEVQQQMQAFADEVGADELVLVHAAPTHEERLESIRLSTLAA
ncbi:LLM class flavin-dependent oxidoreductase [Leucobacter sp. UCMA 4100]|uniref:LLM class flavin-dependent oxidoreductase n=1 Tax=Leucobacter sp. UCMA 4100 TaxID=2810534 RepID=UPI0022EAA142|nr:LLM class flavin-dependent oxidoreductase [Leucobacter sp. UCMA 4100]MDA3147453.1 LLM class flavin-dependent oxidoreductase [Leucobacter sp. UCMA 4100]